MFTKHLTVFVVLLTVVPVAGADEAVLPNASLSPSKVTTEPVQQIPPAASASPSVASLPAEANSPPQQILVRIQLVEINMTKLRKMGVDFSAWRDDGNRKADAPMESGSPGPDV